MTNAKIKISGMHCASCEMLVKDALEDMDGVKSAGANHKTGIIDVDFDDGKVKKDDIIETIKKEGYDVEQ
jgi:copper chaperone